MAFLPHLKHDRGICERSSQEAIVNVYQTSWYNLLQYHKSAPGLVMGTKVSMCLNGLFKIPHVISLPSPNDFCTITNFLKLNFFPSEFLAQGCF